MAFCAKCGTPLNDAGVCPNCGYVLPQNKRPVQSEPVPGVNNGVQDNPVNSRQIREYILRQIMEMLILHSQVQFPEAFR